MSIISKTRLTSSQLLTLIAESVHIGRGGVPIELVLPGEYCSVYAGKGHDLFDWESNHVCVRAELYPHFSEYGRVTAVVRFDEETQARLECACLIRFENKAVAGRVVEAHVGDVNWGVSVQGTSYGTL
uniref:Helicase C-terminal domain-containing protein n=1 Tax=Parascaris univalens TaxID=6257 RepID=A0A915ATB3_PARUN